MLTESKKYIGGFATPEFNCFILEFHMVTMMEAFRRWLIKAAISKLYDIYRGFKDILCEGESVAEKLQFLKKFQITSTSQISAILDKSHKRFIKKKINLAPKIIMSDYVLLEFFHEGYPLSYNSNSFFCRKYYMCTSPDKESKQSKAIIVIDVH